MKIVVRRYASFNDNHFKKVALKKVATVLFPQKKLLLGRMWGFDGKQTIHPSQIETVQNAFLPPKEKMELAKELMAEFEKHEKEGKGAFTFHGRMIDRPLLLQAQNTVKLMERIAEK